MKVARLLQLGFILGAAGLAYTFVAAAQDGELRKSCVNLCALGPNYSGESRLAPDIELKDLNGSVQKLSSYRGKTVLLVFWSSTCDSCKKQMPTLAALSDLTHSWSQFQLLTVAVDDSVDRVRQTLQSTIGQDQPPFPVLIDPESEFVLGRYGTRQYPENWVIDSDGLIRARFDGARDWSNPLAVDYLHTVLQGGYCPLELQGLSVSGQGARVCQDLSL